MLPSLIHPFMERIRYQNLRPLYLEGGRNNIHEVVEPLHVFKKVSLSRADFSDGSRLGGPAIANLIIPKGALVHIDFKPAPFFLSEIRRKCRASEAFVHSVVSLDRQIEQKEACSYWDNSLIYRPGKPVFPSGFDARNGECREGIHFFFDLDTALNW